MSWLLIIILSSVIYHSSALIAYDCLSDYTNITRISLHSAEECNFNQNQPELSKEHIQLIQLAEASSTHIYQCKYNVERLITHCGMSSHSSVVRGSFASFIKEIPRDQCLNMHRHLTYKTSTGLVVDNLILNGTSRFVDVVAGHVDNQGNCEGSYYSDGNTEWAGVVVQHSVTLTLRDFAATVFAARDSIVIEGLSCDYHKETCMDSTYGQSFWSPKKIESCFASTYDVLFDGIATKATVTSPTTGLNEIVYSVISGDTVFALQTKVKIEVCSTFGLQTEHPRLIIVPYVHGSPLFKRSPLETNNLDMFAYINSKFVYAERNTRRNVETMYIDLLTKVCEVEREVLQTQLSIAKVDPAGFAHARMKEPGYTSIIMGEVVYMVKCVPIEVQLRHITSNCYNELPVEFQNKTMFMTPLNHLIQPYGSEVECTTLMSPSYKLLNVWYNLYPTLHKVEDPTSLIPRSQSTWLYNKPGDLATAGIYSQTDMDGLKNQIMYSSERTAVTNTMVRKILRSNADTQQLKFGNLIDENALSSMFYSYWNKAWSTMTIFGTVATTLYGFWFFGKVIKFIIDTVIHAYSLTMVFGFGWRLLGSFWNALTYCLITNHNERVQRDAQREGELREVVVVSPVTTSAPAPIYPNPTFQETHTVGIPTNNPSSSSSAPIYPNPTIQETYPIHSNTFVKFKMID